MLDETNTLIPKGDYRLLARILTKIENDLPGSKDILRQLRKSEVPVIGITGPPGAGKSTLVNALINHLSENALRVAVLAIDPTSPFNFGSLLGDRIRMSEQFNKPNVYIRSIATRGSLGGLSAKAIEMVDVLKGAGFDYIIVETVGVGQSEVEIAGLADLTVVVLVPEAGDEIQQIKSGLMEVADLFVVNKADREGAATFANNLQKLVRNHHLTVIKTIADTGLGIEELSDFIKNYNPVNAERKNQLLVNKGWKLLQEVSVRKIDKSAFQEEITKAAAKPNFNLYSFVDTVLEHYR